MERHSNNTMGSTGTETAILWYFYWINIFYETVKIYRFCARFCERSQSPIKYEIYNIM